MNGISLSIHTLYAELAQQVQSALPDEGTVVAATVKGVRYLRIQRWVGASRTIEHLGRADDPAIVARADAARREMARRKERRKLVSTLRRYMPGPQSKLGKVLEGLSYAGLFRHGAVLVGTAAYQCYSPLLGHRLPSSATMTQDADLATADLSLSGDVAGETMEAILRRADPGFSGLPGLDPKAPPSRFRTPDGFILDLLTPQRRREDRDPMPLPHLAAGATPLQHLDWLVDDPADAVALHGAGIPVTVPQPARFAVHKLIVAQKRPAGDFAKKRKDLMQAATLMNILRTSSRFEWDDALDDARSQGRDGWARPIDRSLKEIQEIDDVP